MGKKSFARKPPVPVPICPLQIPHNLPRSPKPILAVADRNFKNKANYILHKCSLSFSQRQKNCDFIQPFGVERIIGNHNAFCGES
jgi:hypothetical protein